MKPRSGSGRKSAGWRLKTSPKRKAHHGLCRRKWSERATAPNAHLASERTDSSAAVSLHAFSDPRNHFLELYFRLFPGAIRSPQIIEFLWDGLPARRSRAVWDFVRQQQGRIWLEFLLAYAPVLNPTEYIWVHR